MRRIGPVSWFRSSSYSPASTSNDESSESLSPVHVTRFNQVLNCNAWLHNTAFSSRILIIFFNFFQKKKLFQIGSAFVIEQHECTGLVENELPLRIGQKLQIVEYNATVKFKPTTQNKETNNNYSSNDDIKGINQQQWCLVRLLNLDNESSSNQIVEGYVPLRCIKVTCCGSSGGRSLNTPSKSLDEGNFIL